MIMVCVCVFVLCSNRVFCVVQCVKMYVLCGVGFSSDHGVCLCCAVTE